MNTTLPTRTLKITVVSAKLTRDTKVLARMDPFVILSCSGYRHRTSIDVNGSKNPKWNEVSSHQFQISSLYRHTIWKSVEKMSLTSM